MRITVIHFGKKQLKNDMKNMRGAFKIIAEGRKPRLGYQKIQGHMIFDTKMVDFRRKERLVAGGHVTKTPSTIMYASIVLRENVSIALKVAALNYLQVMMAYIHNSYIQSPVAEKIWAVLGP